MAIFTVGFNPAVDRIMECPDFHIGGHQMATQVGLLAAGKAANVSRALALLGSDSIATGFIGTGELELFHEQLMGMGPGRVLCRFVEVAGQTRENITIIDPKRRLETHLRDRGFNVTPAEMGVLEKKLQHDVKAGDVVVFSGSLCGGVSYEAFAHLIDDCTAAGAKVAVDTSGESLNVAREHRLWLLKPNLDELRVLACRDVPNAATAVRDAAITLLPFVQHVLVSRGMAGAVLVSGDGKAGGEGRAWSGRVVRREPAIRTVGCGDHLLAGFVAEMLAGREPQVALRTGLAVATARAYSKNMGEFDAADVQEALSEVEIESLS